ncbi:7533_t:CDS:2, partial [Acaulospora morrowiae]
METVQILCDSTNGDCDPPKCVLKQLFELNDWESCEYNQNREKNMDPQNFKSFFGKVAKFGSEQWQIKGILLGRT